MLDGYDDFVHPTIARATTRPGASPTWPAATARSCEQEYRLVGVDGVGALGARPRGRAGARRRARAPDRRGLRHLRPPARRGRARRGRAPAGVALERRCADRALQPPALLGGAARAPRRARRPAPRSRSSTSTTSSASTTRYGHQIGDVVLREIARRLKDATRPCDVTSRWGGEEFCVLLDEIADENELARLVEPLARGGLGDADPDRRARVGRDHDLDRRRAAVARLPHARAAARQRRRRALRGQARRPQPGAHRPGRAGARAARALGRTRGRRAGARGRRLDARRGRPAALRAGRRARDRRRRRARSSRPRPSSSCAWEAGCTTAARSRCRPTSSPTAGRSMPRARADPPSRRCGRGARAASCPGSAARREVVRSHHERFDGSGYPDGLAGEAIPIAARIVGAADAFVAMTESRPYEGPRGHREAVAELQRSAGSQFDPRVIEALVAVLEHERRGDQARRRRRPARWAYPAWRWVMSSTASSRPRGASASVSAAPRSPIRSARC